MTDSRETGDRNRERLREMMQQPDDEISLARAALVIAACEYPHLDAARYIERLDQMAGGAGGPLRGETNPLDTIARINHYLYEREGFFGNSEDYYNPRNSFLNEVLDRKTGIPITLSTVYLEIAERLGLPLVGVGLPGHFLVKHPYFGILIDPYSKGRILTEDDCRERMRELMGEEVPFHNSYLNGVSKRHIIVRMLNNLRSIYINGRQFQKALDITDLSFAIQPGSPQERKERAALLVHLHRHSEAAAELKHYLEQEPGAKDAQEIRKVILHLRKNIAHRN
jgi:regulator of sirC expression with transglutaminase-like and TPR domain